MLHNHSRSLPAKEKDKNYKTEGSHASTEKVIKHLDMLELIRKRNQNEYETNSNGQLDKQGIKRDLFLATKI